MYDQLIDRLIAAGFSPEHPEDEDARHLGLIAHAGEHDLFTVGVKTHIWGWSQERGSFSEELPQPKVSLYLPHSCDEWVISDASDGLSMAGAWSFAEGAVVAADLYARTLATVNEVQRSVNQ